MTVIFATNSGKSTLGRYHARIQGDSVIAECGGGGEPVVSIMPGDPHAALAAAIAAQAVRDLEAATRMHFGRLAAAHRRAASRRSRPNDAYTIDRWSLLQVRTAIDFFSSELWYTIAAALDLPTEPPAHVRELIAEAERRLAILDEIRKEKTRKEAVSR